MGLHVVPPRPTACQHVASFDDVARALKQLGQYGYGTLSYGNAPYETEILGTGVLISAEWGPDGLGNVKLTVIIEVPEDQRISLVGAYVYCEPKATSGLLAPQSGGSSFRCELRDQKHFWIADLPSVSAAPSYKIELRRLAASRPQLYVVK